MSNILAKIDVKKIEKNELYQGKNGKYLNIMLLENKTQYGDGYIVQLRNQRDDSKKLPIIGNFKYHQTKSEKQAPKNYRPQEHDNDPF